MYRRPFGGGLGAGKLLLGPMKVPLALERASAVPLMNMTLVPSGPVNRPRSCTGRKP